jgi:hypothetical protein
MPEDLPPLRVPLGEPGPFVTPEVRRLLDVLIETNEDFASLAMKAHHGPSTAGAQFDKSEWVRKFEIARAVGMQVMRRVDRDAAEQLGEIIYQGDRFAMEVAAYQAMSTIEGAVRATMIDGPARGASTTSISVSQQTAVAVAVHVGLTPIIERARALEVEPDIILELEDFEESVRQGEPDSDRVQRFARLLEKLRPYTELATELAKLGTILFG